MAETTSVPPLTFGVEFEFMIKNLPLAGGLNDKQLGDPEPADSRPASWDEIAANEWSVANVEQHVRDLLIKYGIPCAVPQAAGQGYGYIANEIIEFSKWEIKDDISVHVDPRHRNSAYNYASIEITTPIYYASSDKPNMGLDEIRKVLSIIRNNFRVHTPPTAGLHVHVGNGLQGFTISHMKNLQSVFYVFDNQIQLIHPNRQFDPEDYAKSNAFQQYFRAPYRCNLGLYLTGNPKDAEAFDTTEDLSDDILANSAGRLWETSTPVEYSQAKRFLSREQKMVKEHIRQRQFFASGPESMAGIGSTNIKDGQPGTIAQRLFRNESTGVPTAELKAGTALGPQLHAHITSYLQQDLDTEIENLLLTPSTGLDNSKKHPDPTSLLAPVKLSQAAGFRALNMLSGTGGRNAAYNINGLAYASERDPNDILYNALDHKKTIEFRQHQGTVDADQVIAWVQMVTGIVEWVRVAPPVELTNLLSLGGKMLPEEFDVVDLLRYMRLDSPADYYEREFFQPKP